MSLVRFRPEAWLYDNSLHLIVAELAHLVERHLAKVEVAGSSPVFRYGSLAQLGEHLPYKQRVTGSSPVAPIRFGSSVG